MFKKTLLSMFGAIALMASFTFADETPSLCDTLQTVLATETVEGVDYYKIGSRNELYKFACMVNGGNTGINGKLTADITVNTGVLGSDGNYSGTELTYTWAPIGSADHPYTGTFDGNNKTISGLYVYETGDNVGLFGYVEAGGTIKNIEVVDSYFHGNQNVAGIVGFCKGCTVEGAHSGAAVNGSFAGGIVGYIQKYSTKVEGVSIVVEALLSRSYNTGNISGSPIGGVVGGLQSAYVEKSYNAGYVNGSGEGGAGGVVGESYGTGAISNCFNVGKVQATSYVGGILGRIPISYSNPASITISNCYNAGETVASTGAVLSGRGCVVGKSDGTLTISNTYYLKSASNCGNYKAVNKNDLSDYEAGKTVAELANIMETDTEFKSGVWGTVTMGSEDAGWNLTFLPYLKNVGVPPYIGSIDPNATSVEISTETQLFLFAEAVNAGKENLNAELKNSITLTSAWNPVGTEENPYRGTFNGNNHVISNAIVGSSVKIQTGPNKGFFGFTDGATIQNVGFVGSDVRGFSVVGGVVANATSTTLSNVFRQGYIDCFTSESRDDGCFAGGLIGVSKGSSIVNSYNVGSVSNHYDDKYGDIRFAGGLIGEALTEGEAKTSIEKSYSVGVSYGKPGKGLVGFAGENQIEVVDGYYDSDYCKNFNFCKNTSVGTPLTTSDFVGETLPQYFSSEVWSAGSIVANGNNVTFNLPSLASFTENGQQSVKGTIGITLKNKEVYLNKKLTTDDVESAVISLDRMLVDFSDGDELNTIDGNLVFSEDNDLSTNPANVKGTFYGVPFTLDLSLENRFFPGDGDVYEIGTAQQLKWFAQVVNTVDNTAKGKLTADIDLNGSADNQWTPIGSETTPYAGTFDGDGHTIKNLYFDNSSATYV